MSNAPAYDFGFDAAAILEQIRAALENMGTATVNVDPTPIVDAVNAAMAPIVSTGDILTVALILSTLFQLLTLSVIAAILWQLRKDGRKDARERVGEDEDEGE